MSREVLPNEIKLLKATCIDYGPGGLTVILSLAKYENHKSTLRACFARRGARTEWNLLLERLGGLEPAERFRLDMMGIELPYVVHKSDRYMTVLDARKWLRGLVFQKAVSPNYFQEYNSKCVDKYEETYSGTGLSSLEEGKWFRQDLVRGPRKTKRIIY